MALPILAAGAIAPVLIQVIKWVLLAKGAAIVIRVLGTLGLAYFTYQHVVSPVLDQLRNALSTLPSELVVWLSALGFFKVVSILASAYTIHAAQRVFLGKRA